MRAVLAITLFSCIFGSAVVLAADRKPVPRRRAAATRPASSRPPASRPAQAARPVAAPADTYVREIYPLLKKYCIGCHGGPKPVAAVSLEGYRDELSMLKARELFEHVVKNVQIGYMPPANAPQPTAQERRRLLTWLETKLSSVDCRIADPGRVTLRRLNRAEYNNTVRDLMGVEFRPADDFPADDVGYGFDNIGDVLSLSPLLLEKYVAAAEEIVEKAIVTPESSQGTARRFEAEQVPRTGGHGIVRGGYRFLVSAGEVHVDFEFPQAGEYLLRARAYGEQAGAEPARMLLRLGQRDLQTLDVAAERAAPKVYEVRTRAEPGRQRFAAVFTNDFYDPRNPDPRQRDRNLVIDYLEIVGPIGTGQLPESHRRIFIARPEEGDHRAAAGRILHAFTRRAYRRPPAAGEVDRLLRIYDLARKEGDSFERSLQLCVQAVLVSPHFLFRVEIDSDPNNAQASRQLNQHELASRLSYFLWSSMPDTDLMALADQGRLHDPRVLEAQARRMLKDPKAAALVENFAGQWLQVRSLQSVSPDPARFPAWSDLLRAAMARETELFFAAIMREDRSVLEFLDAEWTYLNERLAAHYGIPGVQGEEFRRVPLTGDRRGGILTQASVLTITSNPTRTSPVKRGKWVLEQIFGTPPPEPPANVPELKEEGAMLTGTLRQRMEQHRKDPGCASCHAAMDPLGFGLENYDAIGAWRDREGPFPIDASGNLPGGKAFNGPAGLKKILKERKTDFVKNFTRQLLTYALGRGLEPADRCHVDRIAEVSAEKGYRFAALVAEIVRSDPFRKRRGDTP